MTSTIEILKKTLDKMPSHFSSNSFGEKFKRNGGTQDAIKSGVIANYLHDYAIQYGSKRTWYKKGMAPDVIDRSAEHIYEIISQFYQCDLKSASHKPECVRARRAFIYFAKMDNVSDLIIGQFINRHRTHVYNQRQIIDDLIKPVNGSEYIPDRELANDIQQLTELMADR